MIEKTFSKEEIVAKYSRYLDIDVTDDLDACDRVLLCRGRESNLRFFWPPTLAGKGSFYEKLMVKPQYYTAEKWEHAIALESLPQRQQRVLEIGCGDGLFLAMLKQAGHFGTGLEINEEAVRLGISAGLDIRNATVEKFAAGCSEPFDVVCAFQVLEHVTDPCSFLESALHCLRDDGIAIFAVPNGDSIFSSLDVAYDMPPHHMLRWNSAALQFLTKLFPINLQELLLEPISRPHLGLLAEACFDHPSLQHDGLGALRRKAIGTFASKYWATFFNELRVAGHTLLAIFKKNTSTAPNTLT